MSKHILTHIGSALTGGLVLLICMPGASKHLFHDSASGSGLSKPVKKSPRAQASSPNSRSSSPSLWKRGVHADNESLEALLDLGEIELPSRAEFMAYLAANNHPAEGYLAAGMILQEPDLMREALERDASNPHILFALASRDEFPAADRIEWARQLQQEQPQNALASYLFAALTWNDDAGTSPPDSLRQTEEQARFQSFTSKSMIGLSDALQATGCDPGIAALYATMAVDLPHLSHLLRLSGKLQAYAAHAPPREAVIARQRHAALGSALAREKDLISQLVGLSIQGNAYASLPPDDPLPLEGIDREELQLSIEQRRNQMRGLADATDSLKTFPELIEGYATRAMILGEIEALSWLRSRTSSPTR